MVKTHLNQEQLYFRVNCYTVNSIKMGRFTSKMLTEHVKKNYIGDLIFSS